MLSTITPMGEASRGNRFRTTATWFILGATLGGVLLGLGAAVLAAIVGAIGLSETTALAFVVALCVLAAAADAQLFGLRIPYHRRQVNELWLDDYRSWVYGGGFGWQIGAGVVTYVMTAAVPLMIVTGVLTASPVAALAIAATFGAARGLAVLLGARLRSSEALYAFHRRFDAAAEPVRNTVIGAQLAIAVTTVAIVAPPAVAAMTAVAALALIGAARARNASASAFRESRVCALAFGCVPEHEREACSSNWSR